MELSKISDSELISLYKQKVTESSIENNTQMAIKIL